MAETNSAVDTISRSSETVAAVEALKRENTELRAYLKAFCTATIEPEDRGRDVSAHEANPFIAYCFRYVEEGDPEEDRAITGGQVRRAMELVGFDKLKIQPADRTISEELTEARDLRREVRDLRATVANMTSAAADVLAERRRQVEAEGWTTEHDDAHAQGEMANAAVCYAKHAAAPPTVRDQLSKGFPPALWPWRDRWWKPTDRRRDLVKAGALILAEIERLDRAASLAPATETSGA